MATQRVCNIAGCGKRHFGRGLCNAHYLRWRRYGDPLEGGRPPAAAGEPVSWMKAHLGHEDGDCLMWPFAVHTNGYGAMSLNGERLLAHRWVCEQINGPPPSTVHHAAHSCGVRSCVNPHHLRWATPSENCMDRAKHGTSGKGKPGPRRVLTEAQVKRIRRLGPSMSQRQIADLVGTSQGHVGRILRGELWGWLDRRREYGEGGAGPDEDGRAG